MGKDSWSSTNGAGKTTSTCKRAEPFPNPHTKLNSKWTQRPSIKPNTIKLLEENIREKLYNIGFGNDFLDMIPKALREKIDGTKLLKN